MANFPVEVSSDLWCYHGQQLDLDNVSPWQLSLIHSFTKNPHTKTVQALNGWDLPLSNWIEQYLVELLHNVNVDRPKFEWPKSKPVDLFPPDKETRQRLLKVLEDL